MRISQGGIVPSSYRSSSSSKATLSTGKMAKSGRRNSTTAAAAAAAANKDDDPLAFSALIAGDDFSTPWRQEGEIEERNGRDGGAFAWEVADWPDFGSIEKTTKKAITSSVSTSQQHDAAPPPSIPSYLASYDNADNADATTVMSVDSNLSRTSSVHSILSLKKRWVGKVGQHKATGTKSTTTATHATSTTHTEVRSDVETSQRAHIIERVVEEQEEEIRFVDDDDEEEEDDELFSGLLEEDRALFLKTSSRDNDEAAAAASHVTHATNSRSASASPTAESTGMAPSDEESSVGPPSTNKSNTESTPINKRADSISTRFHWRCSKPSSSSAPLSDDEAGHEIAEIAYVLRASLTLQTLVSSGAKDAQKSLQDKVLRGVLSSELAETAGQLSVEDQELVQKQEYLQGLHEFQGAEAKEALMTLNVGSTEEEAEAQLNLLLYGGYIISSTPLGRRTFDEGGTYRFASRKELEATYIILQRDEESSIVGCKEKILCSAIEATLAMPETAVGSLSDSIVYTAVVTSHQRGSGSKGKRSIIRRVRHILTYIVGTDQLTVRDILRLMVWCRDYRSGDYKQQANRNLQRRESDHEQEDRLNAMLFDEYRKRIRLQVRKWLDKSSWQRDDIKLSTNTNGRIVSHHPEDIMFMIQVEMNVVRETLPNSNAIEVMADLLEEFKLSQIGMKLTLKSDWENMDIEWLCAVINDSTTLLEYIENFSIFGSTKTHPVLPTFELRKVRDEVIAGYQELSREACDHLAHSIMGDLQGPVMDHIFTDRWEQEGQIMKCVEATLKDYFEDLSVRGWIPQYEFCRVVRQCISTLAEQYVTAVFSEKHHVRSFSDAEVVPARLVQDRLILMQFFSHVELEMNGRGAKSHAEECLEVLLLLAAILEADEPDDIEEEINSFYSHVGIKYGHTAILHLVSRKAGRYSQKIHDKWDAGLILIADEDQIEGSRLENLALDHLLESHSASSFNFPSSHSSPSPSYEAEEEDETISDTGTVDTFDSDTTMLTNSKACFACKSHGGKRRGGDAEGDDRDDDANNTIDLERLKEIGDRMITLSTETFCWVMDSTLDIYNDLRAMMTKVEEEGCQSCATEVAEDVFMSMSSESFSDFEDENPSNKIMSRREEPKKKRGLRRLFWKRKNSKTISA